MTALFLTLPVRDPVAARRFFGHLGFRFDAEHSDARTACMLVDRNIIVVFQADASGPGSGGQGSGARGPGGPGSDERGPGGPAGDEPGGSGVTSGRVVACLTVDSPAEVDRVLAAAADQGGRVHHAPGLRGGVYGGSFTDPDGHLWELLCPEP